MDGLDKLKQLYADGKDLNRAARHAMFLTSGEPLANAEAAENIDLALNRIGTSVLALVNLEPENVDRAYDLLVQIENGDTTKETRDALEELLR